MQLQPTVAVAMRAAVAAMTTLSAPVCVSAAPTDTYSPCRGARHFSPCTEIFLQLFGRDYMCTPGSGMSDSERVCASTHACDALVHLIRYYYESRLLRRRPLEVSRCMYSMVARPPPTATGDTPSCLSVNCLSCYAPVCCITSRAQRRRGDSSSSQEAMITRATPVNDRYIDSYSISDQVDYCKHARSLKQRVPQLRLTA